MVMDWIGMVRFMIGVDCWSVGEYATYNITSRGKIFLANFYRDHIF